ncbi:MAG: phage tail tube protein [Gemmatimonadaceae bacterium]
MSDRNSVIGVLLAKAETTDGTDAVPVVANDAIQILEPLEANGSFAFKTPRDKLIDGAAIQASPPLSPKGRMATWPNTVHFRGNRTTIAYAATPAATPELHPYMIAAGCSSTLVTTGGSESYTYKPASTGLLGATEYYYVDGKLYKILGAKAEIEFALDAGGPLVASLKRTGLYQAPTDAAVPTIVASSYGTAVPPVADNIALSIAGFSAGIIRSFRMSTGNQIAQRKNANAPGGLATHRIRTRKITFEIVLEDELVGTKDFENLQLTNAVNALSFTIGATQYNKCTWSAPNARIEDVAKSDDAGTQLIKLSGGLYDSTPAANDAFSFLLN